MSDGAAKVGCQKTLRIPKGFQSLLEGFAREVLRSQPTDIYAFGAEYFDKVVRSRVDKTEADDSSAGQIELKSKLHRENNQGSVITGVSPSDTAHSNQAATSPPSNGLTDHTSPQAMQSQSDQQPEVEEAIDIDLNDPEVQAAALKIQKGWGGRRVKNAAKTEAPQAQLEEQLPPAAKVDEGKSDEAEVVDIDLNDPEVQAAALKIQKGWGNRKLGNKQQAP